MSQSRVVVAMSGGVDSSVAAAILKESGYQVIGVTMQLWPDDRPPGERPGGCCGFDAIERARRAAARLGIPHYVMDFRDAFEETVVADFCREYRRGRTPNPCIRCNQYLKFDRLLRKARELDADFLATGHYARIEESSGGYRLLKAADQSKDQGYFLYTLGQAELRHLKFPLGGWLKTAVRARAAQMGLATATAPESQDICFIEDGNYRTFIEKRDSPVLGDIVDTDGNLLGKHRGLAGYTIGQRQGLGLGTGTRLYVIRLDYEANRLVVGPAKQLMSRYLRVSHFSWVSGTPPPGPAQVMARIRYRAAEAEAEMRWDSRHALVIFKEPQKAITPGQAVVFYRGEEVLGGGTIESAGAEDSDTGDNNRTGEGKSKYPAVL
ncbi:MAG: tRNA 2-thiouridine(34) synthase MnmA [Chloroflexota bacterium]